MHRGLDWESGGLDSGPDPTTSLLCNLTSLLQFPSYKMWMIMLIHLYKAFLDLLMRSTTEVQGSIKIMV